MINVVLDITKNAIMMVASVAKKAIVVTSLDHININT
jgi:hypothetical protein